MLRSEFQLKPIRASWRTMSLKNKPIYLIAITLTFVLAGISCEGPQGPQGEQGPEGPVGPAGEDGSVIHAGDGPPDADIGSINDYYLDQTAADLYGPKTQDGWGVPISLQGPPGEDGQDGEAGVDGSQIFAGTTEPDGSTGSPGDYYLNRSTFDLYGPKTESGWGTPINLQGTANVMYTPWFEPDWNQVDEARHKRLRITEFKLTPEFKAGGVILVYHRDIPSPGNLQDTLLPNIVYFVDGEVARVYRFEVIGNGIYIEVVAYTQDLDPDDYDGEHNRFRYVLIPGSEEILSSEAHGSTFSVNFKDYEEVKKYFGIKKQEESKHISQEKE